MNARGWRPQVEHQAWELLLTFQQHTGLPLRPPIDVDAVGERICGLRWEWHPLPEPKGSLVWARFEPHERRVVLNEAHHATFLAKPGVERFSKGHAIGHAVLHADHATLTPPVFPGFERRDPLICRDRDRSWRERQAAGFASALLMPRAIFLDVARQYDVRHWPMLYDLAHTFGVSISALRIRLAECHLHFVDQPHQPRQCSRAKAHDPRQLSLGLE